MANPARGHFSSHTNTSNAPHLSLNQTTGVREPEVNITFIGGVTFIVYKVPNKAPIVTHPPPLGHLAILGKPHSLEPNPVLPVAEQLAEKASSNENRSFLMRKVENEEVTTREGLATASVPCCTGNRSPGQPDKRVL